MFWPIPSDEQLRDYYTARNSFTDIGDGDARRYLADPTPTRGWAQYLDMQFKNLGVRDGARAVEIGCMHGMLSIEMRRLGYDAWGIDLSPDGIKFLNEHGGQGYCGTLFDDACPVKTYDVVIGYHVFEHLPNPYSAFRKIHATLPQNGILHFAVPHWGGIAAQRLQERWKWFTYPEHLHYFSAPSLSKMLQSIGFKVEQCEGTFFDQEVDELLDTLEIKPADRTQEAKAVLATLLRKGALGEALIVTAVKT